MVVYILGKPFKGKTLITYGLASKFFGVGMKTAEQVCAKLGFYPSMRMHQLNEPQVMSITKELSELTIENSLKTQILNNISLKRKIGSYAGIRHSLNLPVRGQRTRNNASTAKKLNRIDRKFN
ncbi:37S ribosomal protein subunit sws2, mitochondrial [Hanseniaspora osmophila]|uniref:37S ribosomal protein SWS2, mitochondrial n=1 Tax=Hanseniaspora osmophila TaxID=56408 RepID=A0A1E5RNM4_9ASCO|nr:37S ribosomal protein SWS2, mitochondrial [Hanseniaspora osmophila]